MKKFFLLLIIIVLVLSTIMPVYADNNHNLLKDDIIKPMYIAHICHDGPLHDFCELKVLSDPPCQCRTYVIKCCCGSIMVYARDYCEDHQP